MSSKILTIPFLSPDSILFRYLSDKFVIYTAYALILRDFFAGPARFFFDSIGLGFVWFAVDAFACLAIVISIINLKKMENVILVVLIFSFTLFEVIYGAFTVRSAMSTISGVKLIIPLLLGLMIGEKAIKLFSNFYVVVSLFLVECAAVIYNTSHDFPWAGYKIEVGDIEKVAALNRWEAGESRIAGLATDNTLAGFVVLILAFFLSRRLPFILRLPVYALAGASLYFTLSKTALMALAILILSDAAIYCLRWGAGLSFSKSVRTVYFVLAISLFALPVFSVIFFNNMAIGSVPEAAWSYVVRATITWVEPFLTINERFFPFGYFLGVGVGMIGTPVAFSNINFVYFYYCDNFALAIFLMFGLPGLGYLIHLIWRLGRTAESRVILTLAAMLLFYGTTIEGFGDATYCMILGGILSPLNVWSKNRPPA